MSKFWDEDSVSEYELLQDEVEENEQTAKNIEEDSIPLVYAEEEELEDIANNSAFELDEEEANIVYNARLRLEMSRLYEMLIDHDLFEGVDASPQAIKVVQDQLKNYIVERLEILLGIREERAKENAQLSSFNDDEADFLRQLAHKGLAMAGKQPSEPKNSGLKPMSKPAPAGLKKLPSQKLKPMVRPKSRVAERAPQQRPSGKVQNQPKPKPKAQAKPQVDKKEQHLQRTQKPVKKAKNNEVHGKIRSSGAFKRKLTKEEAEALAIEDLKKTSGKKPFHKMSAKEKAMEVARVNKRHARKPVPPDKKPPMSFEQQQAMYMQQEQLRMSSMSDKFQQFNSTLAANLVAAKNKGE